jgi:restriction system protein
MEKTPLPTSDELLKATLSAISSLGGKATNGQILSWVIQNLSLSEAQTKIIRSGNRTELEYRLAWARTSASKKGLIRRGGPSTWEAT